MILCILGLMSLVPSPGDRDPVADGAIRRAAQWMAQLSEWSASITVERAGPPLSWVGPQTLLRTGVIRARAPYTFEVTLRGVSDRPVPVRWAGRGPEVNGGKSLADSWNSISSLGEKLFVKDVGGREDEYKLTPSSLMGLVGNLPQLMLWLDRPKLASFLTQEYSVTTDRRASDGDQPFVIVKVEEAEYRDGHGRASLRLFIDKDGLIRRAQLSGVIQPYTVTLSNVRTGPSVGPSGKAVPAKLVDEDRMAVPLGASFYPDVLWWSTAKPR